MMYRSLYVLLCTFVCYYLWTDCPVMAKQQNKQDQIDELKADVAVLTNEIDDLRIVNDKQNERLENITTVLEQLMNSKAGQVAFTAYMTVGHFYPSAGDVIPFNSALLNIGSHYDTANSVFTCPRKGVYFFAFSIYTSCLQVIPDETSYDRTGVDLILDGDVITRALSRNMDDNCMTVQIAGTAVVECPAGGEVWLEAVWATNRMAGFSAIPRTVFTGFVLHYL